MYHIKNDKRIYISLDLIRNGFYALLSEKDFGSITVSEIAERAGVGRATFYRLFDDMEWEYFIPIQVAIIVTAVRTAIQGFPESPEDAINRVVKVLTSIYGDRAMNAIAGGGL
jgi:AcrR family transcriptional regulator